MPNYLIKLFSVTIFVLSSFHVFAFNDLQNEKFYQPMKVYRRSKLANVLFTYELSRRLRGSKVTSNALHPGLVRTNIAKNNGWLVRLVYPIIELRMISPEEGARTGVYLATSPDVEGVTGKFFIKEKAIASDPATYGDETARRLWEISAEMTGL